MSYVTELFSAGLVSALEADAVTLPVSDAARADLVKLLSEDGSYTYASIRSDSTFETVKLYLATGALVMDRAQEGTAAVKHPCGSLVCLISPTIMAALKSVVCEYDCCAEGDCQCHAVEFSGEYLPDAHVNEEWDGCIVFSGDTPMKIVTSGTPSWMNVTVEGTVVKLSGTPNATGTTTFTVAAANCNGTEAAAHITAVTVLAQE